MMIEVGYIYFNGRTYRPTTYSYKPTRKNGGIVGFLM